MPSIKTFRARKQRQAPRASLRLENLEPRLPLAGTSPPSSRAARSS
jgi:hypothetical protein